MIFSENPANIFETVAYYLFADCCQFDFYRQMKFVSRRILWRKNKWKYLFPEDSPKYQQFDAKEIWISNKTNVQSPCSISWPIFEISAGYKFSFHIAWANKIGWTFYCVGTIGSHKRVVIADFSFISVSWTLLFGLLWSHTVNSTTI